MIFYSYGLCATAAALVMLAGMLYISRREKLPQGTASLFCTLGIVLGIAGARLVFCLVNVSTFVETYENPWLMLCFFDGGLSMPGLMLGLAAAGALTARIQKISLGQTLDMAAVPAGLMVALLRIGEPFTDLGVGKVVEENGVTKAMPWLFLQSRFGKTVEYRLNVWAYEAVVGVLICLMTVLVWHWLKKRGGARQGDTALFFSLLFGATQVLLDSMRDDGHTLLIFLRIGQLGAAVLLLLGCAILSRRCCSQKISSAHVGLSWLVMALCVAGVVLLEFSLDGRFTWGNPSMLRDYLLMGALCLVMFLTSFRLLKKASASERRLNQ